MPEVFPMSHDDVTALLEVAWGHLRGHEFNIADKLFRRAWYARIMDDNQKGVNSLKLLSDIRKKSLEGLAMVEEYRSGMITDKHRSNRGTEDENAESGDKSCSQLAHALRASSLRAASSSSLSESLRKRIKSKLVRELNNNPSFCNSLIGKIFSSDAPESSTDDQVHYRIEFYDESDSEQILPPLNTTTNTTTSAVQETDNSVSGERLDRIRDSVHGFVRQVSLETRRASNRRNVPEEMIRNSLGSRLLGLQYTENLPEELRYLSGPLVRKSVTLKRNKSDAACYSKRRASLSRQASFDYSPNNLEDLNMENKRSKGGKTSGVNYPVIRRSRTLPSRIQRPEVMRRRRSSARRESVESQCSTSSASSSCTTTDHSIMSDRLLECWTRVRNNCMANGVADCKGGAAERLRLCRNGPEHEWLDNAPWMDLVSLIQLLIDIDKFTPPERSRMCPIAEAMIAALERLSHCTICRCSINLVYSVLETMACLASDNYVGEALLNERDALIVSMATKRTQMNSLVGIQVDISDSDRSNEVKVDGSAWMNFARHQMRHGRLNTSALLHERVARHVDPTRASPDSRHDLVARITAYLNKALQQSSDLIDDERESSSTGNFTSRLGRAEPKVKGDESDTGILHTNSDLHVEISAHLGDLLLAGEYLTDALACLERAAANCEHVITRAWALSRLAVCLYLESKYIRAQRLFETSHSLLQNFKDEHGELIAFVRSMIGQCLYELRAHKNTLQWCLRALDAYYNYLGIGRNVLDNNNTSTTRTNAYSQIADYHRWFVVRCKYIIGFTYCSIGLYDRSLGSLENCYSTIAEGTDDMHTMLLLRTIGDVLYSREDDHSEESRRDRVATLYGHALRFANSESEKFQIYDRLAVLKVNNSDYSGAGDELDAALASQRTVQRDLTASLAHTLDELSSGFSVAGDTNAAFECAVESLTLTTPTSPSTTPLSMVTTPKSSQQRARTLRRLARLKRSDSHRTEDYLRQAGEVDPLVSGVHYAAYMNCDKQYFSAVLAALPAIVVRSEDRPRQYFDATYLPSYIEGCAETNDEQVELGVRCYALFIAFDCYRNLGMAKDCQLTFDELLAEVDAVLQQGQFSYEPNMAAFACMCVGQYNRAAGYFSLCSQAAVTWYWICVCLGIAQTVISVGSYVATMAAIPQEHLTAISPNDNPLATLNDAMVSFHDPLESKTEAVILTGESTCDLIEVDSDDDKPIKSSPITRSILTRQKASTCELFDDNFDDDNIRFESSPISRASINRDTASTCELFDDNFDDGIPLESSQTVEHDSDELFDSYLYVDNKSHIQQEKTPSINIVSDATDADVNNDRNINSTPNHNLIDEHKCSSRLSSLNNENNSLINESRRLPKELDLEAYDDWQHEEETISTPEVILEVLRNLQDKNIDKPHVDELQIPEEQKMSVNSEISNFEDSEYPSSDSEEEEIFQTWEEYTELPEGISIKVNKEINDIIYIRNESGSVEDKGYNSDSEWITSEEIVDTPDVIIQAMQNNST